MKQLRNIIPGILLCLCVNLLIAQDAKYENAIKNSTTEIEKLLEEFPGIAAAVAIDGEIVWEAGFGYANAETKTPVTPDSKFLYYSLSKSILGAAIYKLQKRGDLDIKAPITQYAPDLPGHYENVTFKHLLSHTAGVRHYEKNEWGKLSGSNCSSPAEAIQVFINDPLLWEPGSQYKYSSFGYVLLSYLIEKISNLSFEEFINAELLEPYQIQGIARIKSSENEPNQAVTYDKWKSKKADGKECTVDNSCKFGGGGFIGTASALAKLHAKLLAESKSSEGDNLYSTYLTNPEVHETKYGYGLGINESQNGVSYCAHTGSGQGGGTVLLIYPEQEAIVVLLGNINSGSLGGIVGQVAKNFIEAE